MVSGNFFKYFGQLFRPPFPLFFALAYSQKKMSFTQVGLRNVVIYSVGT